MNFFEAQDSARRNTWRLAALFIAAVTALIVMTNLLVAAVYAWTSNYAMPGSASIVDLLAGLPGQYWLFISTGVLGVVGVASLYKYMVLRGGGRTIAEALGGSLISRNTTDPLQQRTLNVVEEMAIASGIAVPPVYLINQPSINAFAAGFTPDDAVIGVNQGTIELLNRDELQGVIGHEFSHILNGDTRINLRLIAILHGILFIGMIGYGILRGVGMGARSRRSNSSSGGLPVLALALGLLIIGYAGTFFGNLIKAAVSRQREFLADAAAVQFTRNADGSCGAIMPGMPGFRMPAFSKAILSIVSPRNCLWSIDTGVITVASGAASTLVESNRPPSPVSSNNRSAGVRENARNAPMT